MSGAATENKTSALIRRMGSESGRWNPLPPEQHLFPITHPHVDLTKAEHRGLAWVQLKTVDRFKGEDHPQERTEQAHDSRGDLKASHFAEDVDIDLSNACKTLDALEELGFIRRNQKGVIYLTADGLKLLGEGKAKPASTGGFYKPLPEYLDAHTKGLSAEEKYQFLREWYAAEQWAEDANAQAFMAIYERKILKQKEACRKVGAELKTQTKGKPRVKSPGGPTNRPVIVQLQFVLDPDSEEFINTSWRESPETSPGGSQKPDSDFVGGDASLCSSRAEAEESGELAKNAQDGERSKRSSKTPEADPQIAQQAQQVDELISYRLAAARLDSLGGKLLDPTTIRNIRTHLLRLPGYVEIRQVLALLEDKCRRLAQHPEEASEKTWGWVVGVVKGEVNRMAGEPAADLNAQLRDAVKAKGMG